MIKKPLTKYRALPIQVKASIWFLVCSFTQKAVSVITTPVFTRIMNSAEYGEFGTFSSWMGLISIFVSLNLSAGVYTQGLVKFDDDRNVFSSSMQGLNLILILFWLLIYLIGKEFWNNILKINTIQMLSMIMLIWSSSSFSFWVVRQRVELNYKLLVAVTVFAALLQPTVGIVFVYFAEDKVTARILSLVIVEFLCYSLFFFKQVYEGKVLFSRYYWYYALSFNLPLVPHYLSQTVLNSSDRIMIKNMVGPSPAGIYTLAYSIASIMLLFNNALLQTINPWIYQKIKEKKVEKISSVAYISLGIIALVNLGLIAISPELVKLFAPSTYYDAIYVIPPVAMSSFFMFSYSLFADFEFYYKKTQNIMIASVLGAVLNLILNYIFIKKYGYIAAAYTTLVCYILYAAAHYYFMIKVVRQYMNDIIVYDIKKLIIMSIIFLLSGFIFMATYNSIYARYSLSIILIVVLFAMKEKLINYINIVLSVRKIQKN